MNRLFLMACVLLGTLALNAQTYNFEANYTHWSAQNGSSLALTTDHKKEGNSSLQWTATGNAQLIVTGFSAFTANKNSCFMQIYFPKASNDTLKIEFLNGTSVKRTATMVCNYSGWREFSRAYNEYASTASTTINAVRFTLLVSDENTSRVVCFDDVRFNSATIDAKRVPGTQWVEDYAYLSTNVASVRYAANPIDIALEAPSAKELADLALLRQRLIPEAPLDNSILTAQAVSWVNRNIAVSYTQDSVLCNTTILNTSPSALVPDSIKVISERLQSLASGKMKGTSGAATAFDNYLALLLDQGMAAGCNIIFASNSYTTPRQFIPAMMSILPACSHKQKVEVIQLIRWLCYWGLCYWPEDSYAANLNSDIVYLAAEWMLQTAALYPNDTIAVRDVKAVKRFLERNMAYVPGGKDMLKPDGTGFHHGTHYNNYMYAYQTFADVVYALRGTDFMISEEAYAHFYKALESLYIMATPMVTGKADNRYFANALSGRNAFGSGMKIAFQRTRLRNIAVACPYQGVQTKCKQLYNAAFPNVDNFADVSSRSLDGIYAFNYSPIALARKDNWVATMRAPTSTFFGAEIYSGTNRFGRYQSHGSLEVLYAGGDLAKSGYPTNGTGAGWDWNIVPGTTTVHYTDWQEMMPNGNATDRFDQYSNGTNFVGALASDSIGVFAANLSQTDSWGSQRFTPTNLTAHKSVFIFPDFMVALGSDISSYGDYSDERITATNLFQSIISTANVNALVVNGESINAATEQVLSAGQDHWLLAPTSTGYWLPDGQSDIHVIWGSQTTPSHKNINTTATATAAKAYLHHGVKPAAASYQLAIVPNATAEQMELWAQKFARGEKYEVLAQSSSLHAVRYKNSISYAFYSAMDTIDFGIVCRVSHQHLLIDTFDSIANRHVFSAVNPNLEPMDDAVYGWVSSPTSATLVLEGEWMAEEMNSNVSFAIPYNGKTEVTIAFEDGQAVHFIAIPYDELMFIGEAKGDGKCDKVIENGHVCIRRNGKHYNVLGVCVK